MVRRNRTVNALRTEDMSLSEIYAMMHKLVNAVLAKLVNEELIDSATRQEWLDRIGYPLVSGFADMPNDQRAVCKRVFNKMKVLNTDGGFARVEDAYRNRSSRDRVINLLHTAIMKDAACLRVPPLPVRTRTSYFNPN